MINVLRLVLIGLLFVVFACTQASASGGSVRQNVVVKQRVRVQRQPFFSHRQRVQQIQVAPVYQQAQFVQPVIQQQAVYAQPVVVQRVYAQPVIQQQNYCAPALQQGVIAPGCNAFFAH